MVGVSLTSIHNFKAIHPRCVLTDYTSTQRIFLDIKTASCLLTSKNISLMKRKFVITHKIRQTEIPALPDSQVTNTPSVKMLCPQTKFLVLVFPYKHNTLKCWSVEDRSSFLCLL